MRYILTLFLTLFLTNCVAGMKPEDFKIKTKINY